MDACASSYLLFETVVGWTDPTCAKGGIKALHIDVRSRDHDGSTRPLFLLKSRLNTVAESISFKEQTGLRVEVSLHRMTFDTPMFRVHNDMFDASLEKPHVILPMGHRYIFRACLVGRKTCLPIIQASGGFCIVLHTNFLAKEIQPLHGVPSWPLQWTLGLDNTRWKSAEAKKMADEWNKFRCPVDVDKYSDQCIWGEAKDKFKESQNGSIRCALTSIAHTTCQSISQQTPSTSDRLTSSLLRVPSSPRQNCEAHHLPSRRLHQNTKESTDIHMGCSMPITAGLSRLRDARSVHVSPLKFPNTQKNKDFMSDSISKSQPSSSNRYPMEFECSIAELFDSVCHSAPVSPDNEVNVKPSPSIELDTSISIERFIPTSPKGYTTDFWNE